MLRATFPKGVKELSVSLLQALVLLLFNDADQLSYASIKEQLGIKDERELQRTLLSLSVAKVWLPRCCVPSPPPVTTCCFLLHPTPPPAPPHPTPPNRTTTKTQSESSHPA